MYGLVAVVVVVGAVVGQHYPTRWDDMDIEPILRNERLLRTYFKCVMDQGRCSTDAELLKKHIPDALENECAKCSEKQKANVEKVLKYIYEKKQDMFKQLEAKYDSQGKYRSKYKSRAQEAGYKI